MLGDDLDGLLSQPTPEEVQYTPRTEFDGVSGFIQTASLPANVAPDFTAILTQFGYDPEKVRIVGNPRVSRWQQCSVNRETKLLEERWLSAYRFHLAPVQSAAQFTDIERLVSLNKKKPAETTGPYWMVFQAGDQQLGKRSRDGSTEQIVDRYIQSVEAAKTEFKSLKRLGVEGIQISLPGDCLEGNQSQQGKNLWLTQETITEQTRILRRLMFHTVETLAPLVGQVFLDVVNGNHDQAQRQQNTYPGDGWATETAIAVSDALKLNPTAYGHVQVRVPEKWSGMMTVPVGDTAVTVVHGHQWRPNQGMKWWSEQALNNQPAGAAQILQCGHYHSWEIETTEHRTRIQSSTYDCGSDWYREKRGATNRRGGLVYLLKSGEVSKMSLV